MRTSALKYIIYILLPVYINDSIPYHVKESKKYFHQELTIHLLSCHPKRESLSDANLFTQTVWSILTGNLILLIFYAKDNMLCYVTWDLLLVLWRLTTMQETHPGPILLCQPWLCRFTQVYGSNGLERLTTWFPPCPWQPNNDRWDPVGLWSGAL